MAPPEWLQDVDFNGDIAAIQIYRALIVYASISLFFTFL